MRDRELLSEVYFVSRPYERLTDWQKKQVDVATKEIVKIGKALKENIESRKRSALDMVNLLKNHTDE